RDIAMQEVDGGEVAARTRLRTERRCPFLPPLITSLLFAASSNENVGAPPQWDTGKPPACAMAAKQKRNDLWSMKKLRLLSLVGITSIALTYAAWAEPHGGGGGGF